MKKDVMLLAAGRALQALLNLAALRVMTTFLSPAETGELFLLLACASGFAIFMVTPAGMYINRKIHSWQNAGLVTARLLAFACYLLAVSLFVFLLVRLSGRFFPFTGDYPSYYFPLLLAGYVCFSSWSMTIIPALNMLGYKSEFVVLTNLVSAAGLGLSVLAVFYLSRTAYSWLFGQLLAMCVVSALAFAVLKNRVKEAYVPIQESLKGLSFGAVKNVLGFSAPLAIVSLCVWFQNQGYRIAVGAVTGTEFLGYLAVGFGIAASLGAVVETLFQQVYYPDFYKKLTGAAAGGRQAAYSELVGKTLPVYLVLLVFTVSLSSRLTDVLVASKFAGVAGFVVLGAVFEFFKMTATVLAAGAHAEMRTGSLIRPYAIGGVVTLMTVYAADFFHFSADLMPYIMVSGAILTMSLLYSDMRRIMRLTLSRALLLKTILFSSPLLLFLLFQTRGFSVWSAISLLAAGAYFSVLSYLVVFKWTKSGPPGAGGGDLPL